MNTGDLQCPHADIQCQQSSNSTNNVSPDNGVQSEPSAAANTFNGSECKTKAEQVEKDEELNDELSDIEELIENAIDLDVSNYPPGASVKKKRVLEFRPSDPFSVLPDGWIEVTHNSGLPVYLHRSSRVCTFSRPYFLGKSSVRRHDVPASSIPCFYMRKRQAEIKAQKEQENVNKLINTPTIEIKNAGDKDRYLVEDQLYDYTKSLFKFKTIDVVRFARWSDTRQFQRGKKRTFGERITEFDSTDRPGLPAETKLITVPALTENAKPSQRSLSLNPIGRSSVSLLHDFVQKVLKNSVLYDFVELSNNVTPYRCVAKLKQVTDSTKIQLHQSVEQKLRILRERYERDSSDGNPADEKKDEVILGIGFGKSKRYAKMSAAEKILACLIPGLVFDENYLVINVSEDGEEVAEKKLKTDPEEMFNLLEITDSRIPDLCNRIAQPQPYVILSELIRRNVTMSNVTPVFKTERIRHQRYEFALSVGKTTVKVKGGNKHDGKQRAAQEMLKELFPKCKNWSDILRLYNVESLSMQKEAQRYKRKLTSQATDDLSESFAISNEEIGSELRNALENMNEKNSAARQATLKEKDDQLKTISCALKPKTSSDNQSRASSTGIVSTTQLHPSMPYPQSFGYPIVPQQPTQTSNVFQANYTQTQCHLHPQ